MSSFLEDLNSDDAGQSSTPGASPSGGDGAGESPFLIGLRESDGAPPPSKSARTGLVALLVALVAAGGGLYAMRTIGLTANVAVAGTEIDYAAKHSPAAVDHGKLIDDLKRSGDVVQIPLTDLPINPFAWNAIQEEPEPETVEKTPEPTINPEERARREREREISETLGMLTLDSVLNGSRPVVRISGEIYTLHDTVEGIFTIEKVDGRRVTLSADGETYTLSLEE